MSLLQQILKFRKGSKKLLFTTPTHSQGDYVEEISKKFLGEKIFKCDFSEIEGFDNLRNPKTILKKLLERLSRIYKSKATFILTNGSTSGIEAAMLSVLKEGDKVITTRNCHICVYNGLVLSGAVPVWVKPDYNQEWGIFEGISCESIQKAINENPDAKAVIITSPTYEGIFSDVKGIAQITRHAGMKLIVDEAHGALLNFGNFESEPAIQLGADISVQSLHKTGGALTPAALLHISHDSDISAEKIQESLNLLNTTSPSYPLMVSVEATVNFLSSDKGKTYIRRLQRNIRKHIQNLEKNKKYKIYKGFNDPTKILFKYDGVPASIAAEYLNNKLKIEEEYSNNKSLLFICGIGTSHWKLFTLFYALSKLNIETDEKVEDIFNELKIPSQSMTPKEAFHRHKSVNLIYESINKTAAEPVLSYPPGIPVIIPGEVIDEDIIRFINRDTIKVCE